MRERRGASVRLWIPLDRLVRTKFQFIVPNSESSRFEQVLRHWSLALRWISANVSLFTRMHLRSCIVWRYRTLSKYTLYNVGSCFNCCDSGERGGGRRSLSPLCILMDLRLVVVVVVVVVRTIHTRTIRGEYYGLGCVKIRKLTARL